jgi:orotidine-5'-phosphate decarboxylase
MIDRLLKKIKELQNPTVVGLDPTYSMIPSFIKEKNLDQYGKTPQAVASMFVEFNKAIIDEIKDLVPAVKPQIAMYEQYGLEGIQAYMQTTAYAKEQGLIVIGDIKRGDIASTAAAYAGHIEGVEIEGNYFDPWQEDAITLNPYMGFDGIEPFLKACNEKDKGLFVLVKTSNPSSKDLQDLKSGESFIYEKSAALVSEWGKLAMGESGYSKIGAVVGATFKEQGEDLRKKMPHTFFLVPGYGAQGGSGEDLKGYFDKDGLGIIVNSSRGIIAAYQKQKIEEVDFAKAAREAVLTMRSDLQGVMR